MPSKLYHKPTPSISSEAEVMKYYKRNRPPGSRELIACGGFTFERNGSWSGSLLAKDKHCAAVLAKALPKLEIYYID